MEIIAIAVEYMIVGSMVTFVVVATLDMIKREKRFRRTMRELNRHLEKLNILIAKSDRHLEKLKGRKK